MSDAKKVAATWALVLAVFALFNAAYWPMHRRQTDLDPVNFMRYAHKLHDGQQLATAIQVVRQGIAANHPPSTGPYETLRAWLTEFKDADGAAKLQPTIAFYGALEGAVDGREKGIRAAMIGFDNLYKMPHFSDEATRALGTAAKDLGPTLGVPEFNPGLKTSEQYSLLSLAGGAFSENGKIGDTGTRVEFDLLVQSGGGAKERRIAHIFLRGRDYGGGERGMHVALIDPATGQVLQTGVFDIWSSDDEADRMAALLQEASTGTIGAFAVLDDASVNMNDDLEAALRGFGLLPEAMIMRRARFFGMRYSFAAIGVKGSVPGAAMQAWSPDEADGHRGHPVACGVLQAGAKSKGARP